MANFIGLIKKLDLWMLSQKRTHLYCQTYCKKWAPIRHQGEVLEIQSTKTQFLVSVVPSLQQGTEGPALKTLQSVLGWEEKYSRFAHNLQLESRGQKVGWFISRLSKLSKSLPVLTKINKKAFSVLAQWVLSTLANSAELSWLPLRYLLRPWHILRYRSSAWRHCGSGITVHY